MGQSPTDCQVHHTMQYTQVILVLVGCISHPGAPYTLCSYAHNPLGQCECPDQVFIADDCHKGFLCMDFSVGGFPEAVVAENYDGCVKECREEEVLVVDPRRGDWNCVPKVVNASILNGVCPGKFNTECGCSDPASCPFGECACDGQLWVSHDCRTARYCDGSIDGGYVETTCNDTDIVYVNMVDHTWSCGEDDNRCPGAFHVGCQEDVITTISPTTADSGSGKTILNYAIGVLTSILIVINVCSILLY